MSENALILHFKAIQDDNFYENLTTVCFSWKAQIVLTSKTFVYWTIFSTDIFKCIHQKGLSCRVDNWEIAFFYEQIVGHLPSFFVLTLEHSNNSDEFAIFFDKKKLLLWSWPGLWLSVLAG